MVDNQLTEQESENIPIQANIPQQPLNGPPGITMQDIPSPQIRKLSGSRLVQERARSFLASTFAVAFLLTLAGGFAGSLTAHWSDVKDWLQVVLPAETGLFGSALGFYFGSREHPD